MTASAAEESPSKSNSKVRVIPCSALCGREAVLNLEFDSISHISLPVCATCWKRIDPDGNYLFELITEEEKEVEN
jgi:hypothetical protein